jgi:hypothetical protein
VAYIDNETLDLLRKYGGVIGHLNETKLLNRDVALYTSPPATPAGLGADEIARIIEDNCSVRVQGEYHAPREGLNEAATAILALLSRAGDQSNSTQKERSE